MSNRLYTTTIGFLLAIGAAIALFILGCSPDGDGDGADGGQTNGEESATETAAPPLTLFGPGGSGNSGYFGDPEEQDFRFGRRESTSEPLPQQLVYGGGYLALRDYFGTVRLYGSGETPILTLPTASPHLLLGQEELVLVDDGVLSAYSTENGESRWEFESPEAVRDLGSRPESLLLATEERVIWLSPRDGRVLARRQMDAPVRTLLLGPGATYVLTDAGVVALGVDREERWRREVGPSTAALLSVGESPVIVLEMGRELRALRSQDGADLWSAELSEPATYQAVAAGERLYVSDARGTITALGLRTGALRWSRGVAPGITGRPRYWQGALWIPSSDGVLRVIDREGDPLGSVAMSGNELTGLYGDRELLGSVDSFGFRGELTAVGDRVTLLPETEGSADRFYLPPLEPGGGPILLPLGEEPVSISIEHGVEGVFLFRLPLQDRVETIIDVIDEDGSVVGSNLDKVELAGSLRIRLEGEETYRLEARPVRPELAGELTALRMQLLRAES